MHTVSVEEAAKTLPELVKEVVAGGEVMIVADNAPAVRLVPAERRGYGVWKGQVTMADDFDAPLEDFREYME